MLERKLDISRLTVVEIENKINKYNDRVRAIYGILEDINDTTVSATLQAQASEYEKLLNAYRTELSFRLKN